MISIELTNQFTMQKLIQTCHVVNDVLSLRAEQEVDGIGTLCVWGKYLSSVPVINEI